MNWENITKAVNLAYSVQKAVEVLDNLSLARQQKDEWKAKTEAQDKWEKKLEDKYTAIVQRIETLKVEMRALHDKLEEEFDEAVSCLNDKDYDTFIRKVSMLGVEFN